jgi:hypothetical protein
MLRFERELRLNPKLVTVQLSETEYFQKGWKLHASIDPSQFRNAASFLIREEHRSGCELLPD